MRWVQLAQMRSSGGRWNLWSLPEWSGNLFSHLVGERKKKHGT